MRRVRSSLHLAQEVGTGLGAREVLLKGVFERSGEEDSRGIGFGLQTPCKAMISLTDDVSPSTVASQVASHASRANG